jgi:hypothetical protein
VIPLNWSVFYEKFSVRFGLWVTGDLAIILKQAEDGTKVEEVCGKAGISIRTYYPVAKQVWRLDALGDEASEAA